MGQKSPSRTIEINHSIDDLWTHYWS